MILGNTAAGIVAMETGAKGPNFGVQTACATATHALGEVTNAALKIFRNLHFKKFLDILQGTMKSVSLLIIC
jgi:hypothetical protein